VVANDTLYGTCETGGTSNEGTVYDLPLDGGTISPVVTFDGTNGEEPDAGLTLDGDLLFGSTLTGGMDSAGTIFDIDLAEVPEPATWGLLLSGLVVLGFGRWRRRARE
jgi:uncharacterized repeat protein (TIGR03803 family)